MINCSDLIGLKHRYAASPEDGEGYTDCLLLCLEVRKRLGLKATREAFRWVYEDYEEEELTVRRIFRWLFTYGEVIKEPRPGAIFYLPGAKSLLAMAVVVDESRCLFLGPDKTVIAAPLQLVKAKRYFWAD